MDKVIKLQDSTGTNTLLPWADFMGIDTSNVLFESLATNASYTATQDCIITFKNIEKSVSYTIFIDNVQVDGINQYNNATINVDGVTFGWLPLKKGQVFSHTKAGTYYLFLKAFGIKR